ncbi:MAG: hypothetical protein WCF19_03900 [Chlamydiales bacterium]
MKDLPHHMKKLNRRVIRSAQREEMGEELPDVPTWPDSEKEKQKKAKQKMAAATKARAPSDKSPDQRNKEMKKGRVPVFNRYDAQPKRSLSSKKKNPRI